ncbi:MAG: diguanylate cyclase [Methylophilaceae bacterium]|jgi:diguanylate cyclase (GGDEF)-like protein
MYLLRIVFLEPFKAVLGDISRRELYWLFISNAHIPILCSRRAAVIASRVRLISLIFFVCTPLWIPLDALFLPDNLWRAVAIAHIVASVCFLGLTISARRVMTINAALAHMLLMLLVPAVFYSFVYVYLASANLDWLATSFSMGYTILPFVVVAGMGIFPLTYVESIAITVPILLVQIVATSLELPVFNWPSFVGSLWLLVLISGVATLSCCSQLALMILLVRENIRDSLTGCFARAGGQEMLEFQFEQARRNRTRLTLAFLDLDNFKSINDTYGHDAGDLAIRSAASAIQLHLRASDLLVRWGGEEFLLVFPGASADEARLALERIVGSGFGYRPDGSSLTASIGVAERVEDEAASWSELIEIADRRMYRAKEIGRNRLIGAAEEAPTKGTLAR